MTLKRPQTLEKLRSEGDGVNNYQVCYIPHSKVILVFEQFIDIPGMPFGGKA
jgi:hypothetical protein